MTLEQVYLRVFGFPLSVSFHQHSILIFIYLLLLPEGQAVETCEAFRKQCSFLNTGELDITLLSRCNCSVKTLELEIHFLIVGVKNRLFTFDEVQYEKSVRDIYQCCQLLFGESLHQYLR